MVLQNSGVIAFLSTLALIAISPILPAIGIPGGAFFLGIIFVFLILLKQRKVIKPYFVLIGMCLIFVSYLPALYHISIERILIPTYFVMSLLVTSLLKHEHFEKIFQD